MKLIKKIEVSENVKEEFIKICVENTKKAIIFDRETYEKIVAIRPKQIRTEKIIPIRGTNIFELIGENGRNIYGYNSLDESLAIVYKCINCNLYLLKEMRYINKKEKIDINYNINIIINYIALLILKIKV